MAFERRRSKRIPKPLMVQYLEPGSTNQWDATETKNISAEGLMIITNMHFDVNSTVHLRLKVPLDPFHWLEFDGRVVACEQESAAADHDSKDAFYRLRIEIVKISDAARNTLRQYIEWYLRKEKDTYIPGTE